MLRRTMILGLSLLTLAAVLAAARISTAELETAAASVRPGLRVVMDPVTGEIVGQPTTAELGRLAGSPFDQKRTDRDLRSFELPGGGEGVALEGWGHHALRVERAEDGSLRVVCAQGDDHGRDG